MKGKECNWRDMRKIKHILDRREKLQGEYHALMSCSLKQTRTHWNRTIEVMDELRGKLKFTHFSPTHARELACLAPSRQWQQWVNICEKKKLTVVQLRSQLLQCQFKEAVIRAEKSAPKGQYKTIVVDPPWSYGNRSGRQRQSYADRTMSLEEIADFNLKRWVPENSCHLYLWVTDAYAGNIYKVIDAWGFDPKVWLVWIKDRIGMGNYFRHQHEFCVFAVRGKMRLKRMDLPTIFKAPVTRHSEKPDAFYSLVEQASPGPYLDVFARKRRAGWDAFGDEVEKEYQLRLDGKQQSTLVD